MLDDNTGLGVKNFAFDGMILRYSVFIPRLYNFCKSIGFRQGKILPSRAFCSDENQGFPIILITKHFGSFPFNHGRVGGIVATDRNAPHAEHGKDLVIIQASHVGYEPETKKFGSYRRLQTENMETTASCGKIDSVLHRYISEYQFAQQNIFLEKEGESVYITIDNELLNSKRKEGLFLKLDKMICANNETPVNIYSTSKQFFISDDFLAELIEKDINLNKKQTMSNFLSDSSFYFKRDLSGDVEGHVHLERNLLPHMPSVVTSKTPILTAAILNTQIEFESSFRNIVKEQSYCGKRVLFVSGINIDISPKVGQLFPLTKFVPWAAYLQDENGTGRLFEQKEIVDKLKMQSSDNPDQINLEDAIDEMSAVKEVIINI